MKILKGNGLVIWPCGMYFGCIVGIPLLLGRVWLFNVGENDEDLDFFPFELFVLAGNSLLELITNSSEFLE